MSNINTWGSIYSASLEQQQDIKDVRKSQQRMDNKIDTVNNVNKVTIGVMTASLLTNPGKERASDPEKTYDVSDAILASNKYDPNKLMASNERKYARSHKHHEDRQPPDGPNPQEKTYEPGHGGWDDGPDRVPIRAEKKERESGKGMGPD